MPRPTPAMLERLVQRIDIPEWQTDHAARPTIAVREAFTGDDLVDVPVGTASDVREAFARACAAQEDWARRPVAERARVLARFAELVHARRADLLDIVQAETGKCRASAMDEVLDCLLVARFYAANGPRWLAPRRVAASMPLLTRAKALHQPLGLVGVIVPWNYPLSLSMTDALCAVLAGNGVVMKPATLAPLSALAGLELLGEAGLPRDLWQLVTGSGREVGAAIADGCDYLMFTGSSATGAELASRVSGRLVGFSAELGGKNPMIVGAGANLAKVAEIGVRACFASAGQLCLSIERIYVERSAYSEFCRVFAERVGAMRVGPGYGFDVEMGCMASAEQLAVVEEHVADAVAKGARVLTGGRRLPKLGPLFYAPTLLTDVPEAATCYAQETFGPVASIYPVDTLDEAVARANDSAYGLASAVFCRTPTEGEAIAARLRTGMANVDEGYAAAWSSLGGPSGGMGRSGVGYRHGREGLLKYTQGRTIATQSRLMHLGGPAFVGRERWPELLERATNLMRYLPGR